MGGKKRAKVADGSEKNRTWARQTCTNEFLNAGIRAPRVQLTPRQRAPAQATDQTFISRVFPNAGADEL